MCTIVVLNRHHKRYPLIIAANRDEFYERPSVPPMLLQALPIGIVAPRDLRKGGSWMGVTQTGWFVGLTNQDAVENPGLASRGKVVTDCLSLADHRQTVRYLLGLDPHDFNPFNLVFGRAGALFLCRIHPDLPIDLEIIPEGITIIGNDCSPTAVYQRKVNHGTALASMVSDDDSQVEVLRKLRAVLADHSHGEEDPQMALCVHNDSLQFGTRSSSIVFFEGDDDIEYYHSEGHPCRAEPVLVHKFMSVDFSDLEDMVELEGK